MKLYEIDSAIEEAYNRAVDEETGEIVNEQAYEWLNQLHMDRAEKIENIALWQKNLKSDSEAIAKEIKALQERKRIIDNKVESLKGYLNFALDGEKFSTARVSVSFRHSESVEFTGNCADLPAEFVKVEMKPVKDAMKKAIKNGQLIPGAQIVENVSTIIK